MPAGVFRAVQRPTYDQLLQKQLEEAVKREGDLPALLRQGDVWTVD